jgi:hypothetical protein
MYQNAGSKAQFSIINSAQGDKGSKTTQIQKN